MGVLFGTDGIRGVANEQLTPALAYHVGQAAALVLREQTGSRPTVMIGKDTRISSDMLEAALTAGLCACGADVRSLGVISTPAVSYLTSSTDAAAGIVISASHNPYEYNGIKFFGPDGSKLADAAEAAIEEKILSGESLPLSRGADIGVTSDASSLRQDYISYIASTVLGQPEGFRVLMDLANGAASATAKDLFSRFPGISVSYIGDQPDGVNINNGCGSTHLEALSAGVVSGGYDLGIAFDGDADRCLAVDEKGNSVDGDQIMAIVAAAMQAEGDLVGSGFVGTVMSNIGLARYAAAHGYRVLYADVGDRHVREMMDKEGLILGGEQSGHIIFKKHMPTGDGQLTALHFLSILTRFHRPLSELVAEIPRYPQVLINVPGPHGAAEKAAVLEDPAVKAAEADAEKKLAGDGRILVRPSGTEALLRVMVEASTEEAAREAAGQIAEAIENIQKQK